MVRRPQSELAKARLRACLSQEALAERVGVSRTTVANWERGSRGIYPRNRAKLADALNLSATEISRMLAATEGDDDRPDSGGREAAGAESPTNVLSRREMLQGLGAVALAAGAASKDPLRTGLGHQQMKPVEWYHDRWATLLRVDNAFGASIALPAVYREIQSLEPLCRIARGEDRRGLRLVQVSFVLSAVWLNQDRLDLENATIWADRALSIALEVGHESTVAQAMMRRSDLAADVGDGESALAFADRALNHSCGNSRLQAVSHCYASRGHALLGDDRAARVAEERSREADGRRDVPDEMVWGGWMSETYVDGRAGRNKMTLGDPAGAAEGLEAAAAGAESFHRDRLLYLAEAAVARAAAGEIDRSIGLVRQVAADRAISARVEAHIAEFLRTVADCDSPQLGELRRQIESDVS